MRKFAVLDVDMYTGGQTLVQSVDTKQISRREPILYKQNILREGELEAYNTNLDHIFL